LLNGATIAIIDSNRENRADLRKMLEGSELRVVVDADFGVDAATSVQQSSVDCILVSLEEPVILGLQTMAVLAQAAPDAPIIVYSSLDDQSVVRRAMQAGARDYLRTPLSGELLVPSIRQALEQERALLRRLSGEDATTPVSGTVVTVFGTKGGIGKTMLAANLAMALGHETSANVVLVDMDLRFGCVSVLLDVPSDKTLREAARDVDSITHLNIRDYLFDAGGGVWVLPGPQELEKWEAIAPDRLRRLIGVLSQSFDFVVLDTPGVLSDAVALALEQATLVLLITTQDVTSARNTLTALKVLTGWSYPEERIKLVLNHPNPASGLEAGALTEALGRKIFWEIPYDPAVARSAQLGKPLVLTSPRSEVAKSIVALARQIGGVAPPVRSHRFDAVRSAAGLIRRVALAGHEPETEQAPTHGGQPSVGGT